MESKMDETEKLFTKPGRKMCPDHQEEDLRFFCLSCEVPICRDCKVVTHEGHEADLVANVAKGMREKLVNILEKTELEVSKLKEEAEDTSEKADIKEQIVPNDEDAMNEIRNISNETKAEIDKLVSKIEDEIKVHDEEPNAERMRVKMANLVALKESLAEAMDGDYATVTTFKALIEEDAKYSDEVPEDKTLTRNVVKKNLLTYFKVFLGEIVEDLGNFDVERVASGLTYAENDDDSQHFDNVKRTLGHVVGRRFRSAAKGVSGTRFQSLRRFTALLSPGTGFWLLWVIFCSLPILQSVSVGLFLFNAPHVHPVVGMVLSGICVSSGLLMLSGNPRQKYGTLLLAGVLAYLTFYPYLESISTLGTSLIWSRHQGCIGLYFIFAGRKSSSKAMELIGDLCTIGYVIASALILWDERIQILFPGGKLGFIAVSILFILLVICFAKEKYVKHVSLAVGGGIVLASSLIFIDKTLVDNNWKNNYFQNRLAKLEYHYRNYHSMSKHSWDEYEGIKMTVNRLSWTVVRLVVCNVSIVVGMLVVIEQEITTFCQRLFKFVKARMVSMDDHRN